MIAGFLAAGLALGAAACGSSAKSTPTGPGSNTPTTAKPASSGGGYGNGY